MIEVSERCPECGGENIQIIDHGRALGIRDMLTDTIYYALHTA